MSRWVILGLLALAALPAAAVGQEPDSTVVPRSPALVKGDTVRLTLEFGDDVSEYRGEVREVINPRQCLFVRLTSIEVISGREIFSFGTPLWPTTTIERLAGRAGGDPVWETIRGRRLLDDGIRCLEGHSRTDEGYLNPDSP